MKEYPVSDELRELLLQAWMEFDWAIVQFYEWPRGIVLK